jgi:hypothetical protein
LTGVTDVGRHRTAAGAADVAPGALRSNCRETTLRLRSGQAVPTRVGGEGGAAHAVSAKRRRAWRMIAVQEEHAIVARGRVALHAHGNQRRPSAIVRLPDLAGRDDSVVKVRRLHAIIREAVDIISYAVSVAQTQLRARRSSRDDVLPLKGDRRQEWLGGIRVTVLNDFPKTSEVFTGPPPRPAHHPD